MEDDLDSFFAKKAAKQGKKPLSQDTDSLARKLEKAVKYQEQIDRVREEEERINKERIEAVDHHLAIDDSDWIEVEPELNIESSEKLQELDIEEIHEDDEEETLVLVEKPKTWEFVSAENEKPAPVEAPPVPVEPKKYVVRQLRQQPTTKQPNIQDTEQFPSLMAADDISKKELENKKLKDLREKEFYEKERDRIKQRQKQLGDGGRAPKYEPLVLKPEEPAAATEKGPAKYVPPYRKQPSN